MSINAAREAVRAAEEAVRAAKEALEVALEKERQADAIEREKWKGTLEVGTLVIEPTTIYRVTPKYGYRMVIVGKHEYHNPDWCYY